MADVRSYFVPFDLDSGGGTENVLGVNLRLTSAGGSIEALGSQVAALSIPVVIASDQGALDVSGATVTVDSELPSAVSLADNTADPTAPAVGAFGMVYDGTNWDKMRGDETDGVLVNLGGNNNVTVDGTVTVDSELPTAAALGDAEANPTITSVGSFISGFNGTTWDRVRVANTGRLQVDVITGGGSDTPTNPVVDSQTSVAVAAGASADIDSSEAASKKLAMITVWSSVAWKGEIHTVDNAVESPRLGITGGQAFQAVQFKPTHRDYIQTGTTAGADNFRVEFTNLDDNQAADAHVVFHYED